MVLLNMNESMGQGPLQCRSYLISEFRERAFKNGKSFTVSEKYECRVNLILHKLRCMKECR